MNTLQSEVESLKYALSSRGKQLENYSVTSTALQETTQKLGAKDQSIKSLEDGSMELRRTLEKKKTEITQASLLSFSFARIPSQFFVALCTDWKRKG